MPNRVIYLLYRTALLFAFPFILAYLAYRCLKNRAYWQTLPERFGFLPESLRAAAPGSIWLHAISVGEVISAAPLIAQLRAAIPGCHIYMSVGTLAGRQIAGQKLASLTDGIFWAPLDFAFAVRFVLRHLRPALVVVMETEIWPNMWREAKRSGAGLLVLNGRISDSAIPRYRQWRWLVAAALSHADRILAQTEISRDRYVELGADPARVEIGGNLKYDFDPTRALAPEAVVRWASSIAPGFLWIAASTMPPAAGDDPDEDEAVLDAFTRLVRDFPGLHLILVPRRPERFSSAAASLEKRGIAYTRRSQLPSTTPTPVLLLDSMGELAGVFRVADFVFVGGTLCRRGGHNILEPAFFSKPVLIGPHMENFPEIAADFRQAAACLEISTAAELEPAVRRLLSDHEFRAQLGERARAQALRKTGATPIAIEAARRLYETSLPRRNPGIALRALAALWRLGGRWKRRRGLANCEQLSRPVISVGGIGVGGVGKTPFVLRLAALLRDQGAGQPAFLTRGYKRVSQEQCSVIPASGPAPVELTGDEGQLLVRSGLGPVGICPNRSTAGQALLRQFDTKVFLLDDGFQHARLSRNVDLVLIDTLDPFGGFHVLPAGRLREPLSALGRASAFILMRCEAGRNYEGIQQILATHNPNAPIFRARLAPGTWYDADSGTRTSAPSTPGGAFCGLGNPASFWRTLEAMGLAPTFRATFPDHHRYHPRDLRRLSDQARQTGVTVLWTTEKDAMNLPANWRDDEQSVDIRYLSVEVKLEDEPAFMEWLKRQPGLR